MPPEEYCAAMSVRVRGLICEWLRPEWDRAREAIRSVPPPLLDFISHEPAYSCGFEGFLITAECPHTLVGRFQIGVLRERHRIGQFDTIDRIYFATIPVQGGIPIGEEYTDEQLIEMLSDSIVRVVGELLAGEERRIG